MADIFINIQNDLYKSVTQNKGVEGLGNPRAITSNPNIIRIDDGRLTAKLSLIRQLKTEYVGYNSSNFRYFKSIGTPTEAPGNAGSTRLPISNDSIGNYYTPNRESEEAMVLFYFILRLRDILFPEGAPAALKDRNQFRTYWEYNPSASPGDSGPAARDFAVKTMDEWITLITDILALKSGLSSNTLSGGGTDSGGGTGTSGTSGTSGNTDTEVKTPTLYSVGPRILVNGTNARMGILGNNLNSTQKLLGIVTDDPSVPREPGEILIYESELLDKKRKLLFIYQDLLQREVATNTWAYSAYDFPFMGTNFTVVPVKRQTIEDYLSIQNNPEFIKTSVNSESVFGDGRGGQSAAVTLRVYAGQAILSALFCSSTPGETANCASPSDLGMRYPDKWAGIGAAGTGEITIDAPWQDETYFFNYFKRTYVNEWPGNKTKFTVFLSQVLRLIDDIISLSDPTLSRPVNDVLFNVVDIQFPIDVRVAKVSLGNILIGSINNLVQQILLTYLDDNLEYKRILHLGADDDYLVQSWRSVPSNPNKIQVKLFKEIKSAYTTGTPAYLSREFASSITDRIQVLPSELADTTPFLRPRNLDVEKIYNKKNSIKNQTIETLGSLTPIEGDVTGTKISYEDREFNKWFTNDLESSELNIDFSDYSNFVYFGSAEARLSAFAQKLIKMESLQKDSTTSVNDIGDREEEIERNKIIRNFDAYEQYLYFGSQSIIPYSASAYYADGGTEYHVTGSWPKTTNNVLYSPTNDVAINWYTTQSAIARRFDEFNPNQLIKHLPQHIVEDDQSIEFLKFISMFGHVMDNIKVYADQFPYIYSTSPEPFEELSLDQIYEVATGFGINLPNAFSIEKLQNFISYVYGKNGTQEILAETWKRFLHSSMFLAKTKGSRTSINTLMNVYGIRGPMLQVKESTYPGTDNFIESEELTYGLMFTTSSTNYLTVPLVSQSIGADSGITGSTVQIRFKPSKITDGTYFTLVSSKDSLSPWYVNLVPHPSSSKSTYGKITISTGSAGSPVIVTSSNYFPLFSDDYTHIMLRSESSDFTIVQTDGDQILFQDSGSLRIPNVNWNSTVNMVVGGSPTVGVKKFDGIIDEIRVWGENISKDNFIKQAYDPGAAYGNYYTSGRNKLYTNITFSIPTASITQYAENETPFIFTVQPPELNIDPTWAVTQSAGVSNEGWQFVQDRKLTSTLTSNPTNKVSDAFPAITTGSAEYAAKIGTRDSYYIKNNTFNAIPITLGSTYNLTGWAYASGSTYRGIQNGGDGTADYKIGYIITSLNSEKEVIKYTPITSELGSSGWRFLSTTFTITDPNEKYLLVGPFIDGPYPYTLDEKGNSVYGEPVCSEAEKALGCPGFAWFTGLTFKGVVSSTVDVKIPATGLTVNSYKRILRNIKQYTPIVGSTANSTNLIKVAPPPVFNSDSVGVDGSYILRKNLSIKSVKDKIYTSGQDMVTFAVSPTDYINQDIVRRLGIINVNNLIGSPRKIKQNRYTELQKLSEFYNTIYTRTINQNKYITFFNNILQAPNQYVSTLVPVRAKLTQGIVIQQNILDRSLIDVKSEFSFDGSNTNRFDRFSSGSLSGTAKVGAYSVGDEIVTYQVKDLSSITNINPPLQRLNSATLYVTSSVLSKKSGISMIDNQNTSLQLITAKGSTPVESLVQNKKYIQYINTTLVSSSIADANSGIAMLEADNNISINPVTSTTPLSNLPSYKTPLQKINSTFVTSSINDSKSNVLHLEDGIISQITNQYSGSTPYTRKLYPGLTNRIPSEENTIKPLYAIPPRTDFDDVGSITYFHKKSGKYVYRSRTKPITEQKKQYLVVFDTNETSTLNQANSPINLLDDTSDLYLPGRYTRPLPLTTYTAGGVKKGVMKIANIFSLLAITGASLNGLRIRMYASESDQINDESRPFTTTPTNGVLFDIVLSGETEIFPYTLIQTEDSIIYYTVNNTTSFDITTTIRLSTYAYLDPALYIIPRGYLPRHHKFTKDQTVANRTSRYLGSRLTYCEGTADNPRCPPGFKTVIPAKVKTTGTAPLEILTGEIRYEGTSIPNIPFYTKQADGEESSIMFVESDIEEIPGAGRPNRKPMADEDTIPDKPELGNNEQTNTGTGGGPSILRRRFFT